MLPVKTIARYAAVFDEHAMPLPVVEHNDAAPWVASLRRLLGDRAEYEHESRTSRAAAEKFVSGLHAADMEERYLLRLERGRTNGEATATMESLSPEKRALLLERLRKRGTR